MIEVRITNDGKELGKILIENVTPGDSEEYADFSIRFGVDKNNASGIHQRSIYMFPRKRYNVLGLLRQCLNTLDEEELRMHEDLTHDDPKDKVRRLGWGHFFS